MNADATQRNDVQRHFDKISADWARRYEGRAERMSDLNLQLRRENVHRLLQPIIASNARSLAVLDLGCGTGDVLNGLPRDSLRVVGVDLSPEMAAQAARGHPHDRFLSGDLERLPFARGSADVVTCVGVLEYTDRPEVILKSIAETLAPGGHLLITFPNGLALTWWLSSLELGVERGLLSIFNRIRGRVDEELGRRAYRHRRWTPDEARGLLKEAGFDVEQVLFNTFGLWGRTGRLRASLALSRWMTARFRSSMRLGGRFALTMAIRARKAK